MSSQRIRELLAELEQELNTTSDIDAGTRQLLRDLDEDIDKFAGEDESALDRVKQLESQFAADYPVAARIARELADILAKMGV